MRAPSRFLQVDKPAIDSVRLPSTATAPGAVASAGARRLKPPATSRVYCIPSHNVIMPPAESRGVLHALRHTLHPRGRQLQA
jgi:hypothetical protein